MTDSDNLRYVLKKQKELFSLLEKEANGILDSDLVRENETLKKEMDQNRYELLKQREKLKQLSSENSNLKNALYDQIYSEKIRLVAASRKKSDMFFKGAVDGELNRLARLEKELKDRRSSLSAELRKSGVDASSELLDNSTIYL